MARNVEDVRAAARRDVRRGPARSVLAAAHRRVVSCGGALGWRPKRVAWSVDLGITMADNEVAAITRKAAERFAELGATVEEAHPDFTGLHECFITLRVYDFFMKKAVLLREHRDLLKPEVIWNIEKGYKIDLDELERAENTARRAGAALSGVLRPIRSAAHARDGGRAVPDREPLCGRGERPQVRELRRVAARSPMRSRSHAAPRCRCPAASRSENLPVGLQIAGPPRSEARILAAAKALEDILGLRGTTPIDPRVMH